MGEVPLYRMLLRRVVPCSEKPSHLTPQNASFLLCYQQVVRTSREVLHTEEVNFVTVDAVVLHASSIQGPSLSQERASAGPAPIS